MSLAPKSSVHGLGALSKGARGALSSKLALDWAEDRGSASASTKMSGEPQFAGGNRVLGPEVLEAEAERSSEELRPALDAAQSRPSASFCIRCPFKGTPLAFQNRVQTQSRGEAR